MLSVEEEEDRQRRKLIKWKPGVGWLVDNGKIENKIGNSGWGRGQTEPHRS